MKRQGTKLLLLISVLAVAVFVSVFAITASADNTVNYFKYSTDGSNWTVVTSNDIPDGTTPGNYMVSLVNSEIAKLQSWSSNTTLYV